MLQIACIAVGGGLGALLRFWAGRWVGGLLGSGFPYGTLCVNVLGSFAMGCLFVLVESRTEAGGVWRAGLLTGLLGAFTTFSAFSIETLLLLEAREFVRAGVNVVASVSLCLSACYLGICLGRGG